MTPIHDDYLDYIAELERYWRSQPKELTATQWADECPEMELEARRLVDEKEQEIKDIEQNIYLELQDAIDFSDDRKLLREIFLGMGYGKQIIKLQQDISWLKIYLAKFRPRIDSITDEDIQRAMKIPISDFLPFKDRTVGGRLLYLCPFHDEKTPSFTVYTKDNTFNCYGCGANGNVIHFIQKQKRLDFIPAVKFLLNL